MRWVIAMLLALVTASAAPAAAPARDWRQTVTQTTDGAYQIGNPKAKVQLVEYLSYTCPHCARVVASGKQPLDALVRKGSVRIEFRHAVRDVLDLSAALLARCGSPAGFLSRSEAIFAAQDDWAAKGDAFLESNGDRLNRYPPDTRLPQVAEGAGLVQLVQPLGVSAQAAQACLADTAAQQRLAAMAGAAWNRIQGTPTFEINGQPGFSTDDWNAVAAKLRAAGAS